MKKRMGGGGDGGGGEATHSSCDAHAKPRRPTTKKLGKLAARHKKSPPVCSGLAVKPRPGSGTMSFSKALSPNAIGNKQISLQQEPAGASGNGED